ncbi:MAG: hypothetical protein EF807_02225 [Candidatus Methanolliviera hydrocarbonicum]|mgnify:CR=1 FL=1|uniref:Uncharacterized protein n=1 Tax=Candidatus Methanolliviera hydrocarbonicum TaxID=2491085 RepID=A0A520KXW9_9EURY|nr:MAG: hypothetical protein EF807_02225 [Candidatus Methanolliviera hydrocarbonicum]
MGKTTKRKWKKSDDVIIMIKEMRKNGYTLQEIADATNTNVGTVAKYAKENTVDEKKEEKGGVQGTTDSANLASQNESFFLQNTGGSVQAIIKAISENESMARNMGVVSGVNLATSVKNASRLARGEGGVRELGALAADVGGTLVGWFSGWREYQNTYPSTSGFSQNQAVTQKTPDLPISVEATALRYFDNGKTPNDLVKDEICSMAAAKRIWKDYWIFANTEKKKEEKLAEIRRLRETGEDRGEGVEDVE